MSMMMTPLRALSSSNVASSAVRNVVIIGSGPSGMTAAIYLSRANFKPLVLHGDVPGT